MSDPLSTGASIGVPVAAFVVALVGVEPQTLFWGAVGSFVGLTAAPATGRMRAVFLFIAVVLSCALLGTFIADTWFQSKAIWRNVCSLGFGFFFHLIFSAVAAKVPEFVGNWLGKLPGGPKQ